MRDKLIEILSSLSQEDKIDFFDIYYALLTETNKKFNITAITERDDVYLKHFIDCILGDEFLCGSCIDIGTGGGFPGLVLKILHPESEFILVDSLNKRVEFLQSVITKLKLENVSALHSRAEELDKNKKFDTCVSRALAPLNVLCEYCLPFIKVGGRLVAYKASNIDEEITAAKHAIKILGGKISRVVEKQLPTTDIIRKFVIIEKISDTPLIYPRGQNKPKLQPL